MFALFAIMFALIVIAILGVIVLEYLDHLSMKRKK